MNYIIFDLEWNNAYNYKTKKGINEIIEIGAVILNDNLEITDTFKQLIKPRISKKLGSRFKNLTNITKEEINQFGVDFDDAFADFERWCSRGDNIFLSWSTSDLYTLIGNFVRFKGSADIPFIRKYVDLQKYCMQFIECTDSNQISLSNYANIMNIDLSDKNLHRALEDCFVEAYCFKKVFDKEKLKGFVSECDKSFFERMVFKPYFLTPSNKEFDVSSVDLHCPFCKNKIELIKDYEYNNNAFKSAGKCSGCGKKLWILIRAKKTYDGVCVSKRITPINKKRAKHIN